MYPVKQSTALTVPVFVHDANGDAVTGLTDGSFTKRISKNGGAFAAMTVTLTEMENGWYSIPLSTSHTDTLGLLSVTLTNAGAKQANLQFRVFAKLIDDLNDVAATDIVSAGAITTLSGAVVNVDTVDTLTTYTGNTPQTGDSFARLGAPVGASISADIQTVDTNVDAVLVDTASIGVTKNAALSNFTFPMKLSSDHYTAATGKTVTGVRIIDGAAPVAVSGTIAEVGSGIYQFDALAADTNGDVVTWLFSAADCDDTEVTFKTRA